MFRFYNHIFTAAALVLAAFSCWGQTYAISTFAGQGLALGDGGPAANARFGTISAIAIGRDGTLYIADSAYHQVRKIGPDGNITLFAGGPVRGFGGDGGPATSAMLDTPTALLVDSGSSVYIGDSGNHRVRVVTHYGNIQTVAGNGQMAPSPAMAAVLPGEGGPATAAPLNQIAGLGFANNSDLLISDSGNNRIFRVSRTGNISTVAGNATTPASLADQPALTATLSGPGGILSDYLGNIYFTELSTSVVRRIDLNGTLSRFMGTGSPGNPTSSGSPLSYPLVQPSGLAADGNFNIYVIEAGRVSMYTPPSFAAGTLASVQVAAGDLSKNASSGDGGAPQAAGMNPRGVAVDSQGTIYVADSGNTLDFHNRLRAVTGNVITTFAGGKLPAGKGDAGNATAAELYFPRAVAIDPASGTVYIADTADNRVRAVTGNGVINTYAGNGTAGTSGDQGPATAANLNPPTGLALDSSGNVYIADGARVRQVAGGTITTFAGGGSSTQEGAPALSAALVQDGSLAVDAQNNVYVDQLSRVSQVASTTQTISTFAGTGTAGYSGDNGPATAAQIDDVAGIAVDSNGNLYIADEDNGRIRKVDATGNITTIAGGGTSTADGVMATNAALNIPLGVALDIAGNLYIAEYGGNRIRMVDLTGSIRTVGGNGLQGYSGDGSLATNASLNGPTDVKVDAQGNLYVADSLNSSIRKLTPVTVPPTPAISTIANAASLAMGPVAPGERVILTGTALGPNSNVFFDNTSAPVLSSSLTSTMVVVPYEVSGRSTSQVTVSTSGVVSAPFAVQIAASAPGIYTTTADGKGQAVAFGQDGSLNSAMNPVPAGGVASILCTGAGVLSPAVATGVPIPQSTPSPALPVSAMINGVPADIDQAYSIPGTIGQFLVDVRIPYDVQSSSSASVQITVGSAMSQPASIAVQASPDSGSDSGSDVAADSLVREGLAQPGKAKRVRRALPPLK